MSIESMARALRVAGLQPREKLVLLGIANHDGDGGSWPSEGTLAAYADCTDRQVRRLIDSLVQKGYVSVEVNGGGSARTRRDRRPNLYTIDWARVDISVATGGHFAPPRVDIQVSTEPSCEPPVEPSESSSLRSEETQPPTCQVPLESGMDQGAPCSRFLPCPDHPSPDVIAQIVARGYWDWHVEENGGPPAQDFKALLAVARACLKREYPPDEIVDAMKRERFRSITAKRVIERIGEMRRAAQDRPSTVAIPSTVVKAINAATPFFVSRWSGRWCGAFKAKLMEAVAAQLRRNYSIGETMIRLAIAMREIDLDDPFWLTNVNIPRSDADLTDIPGDMERAYVNRTWTWR